MSSGRERLSAIGGRQGVYFLELFAQQPFVFDDSGFLQRLQESLGSVTARSYDVIRHHFLNDVRVKFDDGNGAAQILIASPAPGKKPNWDLVDSIDHSRRLPDAAKRLAACPHRALLHDFMSAPLDHHVRRRILAAALQAAVENSNVELVHFVPTMEVLDAREAVRQLATEAEVANPTYGFLNVRLLRTPNVAGELVMDTLGLSALGLTDVQIHFRDLDPNEVAGFLYGLGRYLLEKGDVIETDHTVEGLSPGERWRCRRERSLAPPERVVIDINPGVGASGVRRDG
jgi:hypothetical protein